MSTYDVAIVGGGPAGLSAAVTARVRGKSVVLFESGGFSDKLRRAEKINNYLGFQTISGTDLMDMLVAQTKTYEPEIVHERVQSIFQGEPFTILTDEAVYTANSVILATGVTMNGVIPGEKNLLGRGVSYCATCDGHFFKDKNIAIYLNTASGMDDVKLLADLARTVALYVDPLMGLEMVANGGLPDSVTLYHDRIVRVNGTDKVETVSSRSKEHTVDGFFILRDSNPPDNMIDGLEVTNNAIEVNRFMETNFAGLFAAGDVAGGPLQVSKAVGDGQMAAFSAVAYVNRK
ncbi:MAG: NAD(P)/FAD-dependent oxidoreductase [Veillonella sp.]|uniref:NAD(P)/FAD-dependent oxidoreductase n=1 Tax=Veillonella sp. TaxID=1926307 RepID=UPI0025F1AFA4|nr:NAD(P)/FAD-dependent oxidoreductase [Veillonella sp.]MBS4913793.1 NAD(P)/FAD-dependent oxidoreductase [Veillonella sp.]